MNNEQRDQRKFNTILLTIAMMAVIACTLTFATIGAKMEIKRAYVDQSPVTCVLNTEEGLCNGR